MCCPRRSRARTVILLGLVLVTLMDTVSGIPYRRSLLRLCSTSLSDALHLACKDRGYNEPFSYSGEDDPQDSPGPGLAEECCYHQCSYAQLEQYCKPDKGRASSADVESKSVWIVNLPSSEERSRTDVDYVSGTIRCRIHGPKGTRRRVEDDCERKGRRHRGHCACRYRRMRRRRPTKVLDRPSKHEASSLEPSSKGSPFS